MENEIEKIDIISKEAESLYLILKNKYDKEGYNQYFVSFKMFLVLTANCLAEVSYASLQLEEKELKKLLSMHCQHIIKFNNVYNSQPEEEICH